MSINIFELAKSSLEELREEHSLRKDCVEESENIRLGEIFEEISWGLDKLYQPASFNSIFDLHYKSTCKSEDEFLIRIYNKFFKRFSDKCDVHIKGLDNIQINIIEYLNIYLYESEKKEIFSYLMKNIHSLIFETQKNGVNEFGISLDTIIALNRLITNYELHLSKQCCEEFPGVKLKSIGKFWDFCFCSLSKAKDMIEIHFKKS